MDLHSSDGIKSSAALTQRPWVRIPLRSRNYVRVYLHLLAITTATIISLFKIVIIIVIIIIIIIIMIITIILLNNN